MHNRLIFLYHQVRARTNIGLLRGCPSGRTDPPGGG